jgi:hypothetical protein
MQLRNRKKCGLLELYYPHSFKGLVIVASVWASQEVWLLNAGYLVVGGHLGRFIVWTKSAFEKLDAIFGTHEKKSLLKKDYILPRNIMGNPDLARIINSDEIQSVVRPTKTVIKRRVLKKNPLKNLGALLKLNPYAKTARRMELLAQERQSKAKAEKLQSKRSQLKVLHFDHTMVAFVFVAPCSSVAGFISTSSGLCLY